MDWKAIEEKKITPPIQPEVKSSDDYTNFAQEFLSEDVNDTIEEDSKLKITPIDDYMGFSYTRDVDDLKK